jgi:hypothetical protein
VDQQTSLRYYELRLIAERRAMKFRTLTLTVTVLLATAISASAEGPRIGQVKTVSGEVAILRDSARLAAKPGDPVYPKDIIETGEHGAVGISFVDNSVFSAGPDSQIGLDEYRFDRAAGGEMLASMPRGTLSVVSGEITKKSPGALKIKTPTAILGVRGTTFAVQVVGERK